MEHWRTDTVGLPQTAATADAAGVSDDEQYDKEDDGEDEFDEDDEFDENDEEEFHEETAGEIPTPGTYAELTFHKTPGKIPASSNAAASKNQPFSLLTPHYEKMAPIESAVGTNDEEASIDDPSDSLKRKQLYKSYDFTNNKQARM